MHILKSEKEQITLYYGQQTLNGNPYNHKGLDFVKQINQLDYIVACQSGIIINVEKNVQGSANNYGNMVHIQHGGNISSLYAHMQYGSVTVNIGDRVEIGQVIGYMGKTGYAFGAHLHFEVRENNVQVDPLPYMQGIKNIEPINPPAPPKPISHVKYKSHIQNIGWQEEKQDGEISGTVGENKRIEAFKLSFENIDYTFKYRAYIENKGWGEWKPATVEIGTIGESLRLEAIEFESSVPLIIQEHIQNIGWTPEYRMTSGIIGTVGKATRLEALRIRLA